MNPNYRTVYKSTREALKNFYPEMTKSQFGFLGYLMFSGMRDDKGKLPIPARLIAGLENKHTQFMARNFDAEPFLIEFQKIQPFKYSGWVPTSSHIAGKARTRVVYELEWPEEVQRIMDLEREGVFNGERVYITTGNKVTRKTRVFSNKLSRAEAFLQMAETNIPEAKATLKYLNELPIQIFDALLINAPEAFAEARTLKKESMEHQEDLILQIIDQVQPFYKSTRRSTRLFPDGENICLLKKQVRRKLTSDWIEFDLRSAQLAISTKLWGLTKVEKFLKDGGSIWDSLTVRFEVLLTEENKAILKTAMYALMFGSTQGGLRDILEPFGKNALYTFLKHPVINEIYRARNKQLAKIKKDKGAFNCFGEWLPLWKYGQRSILAQLSQSYELKLLYPCIQFAIGSPDFDICLWQHDGFSITFHTRNYQRKDEVTKELITLVKEVARKEKVSTELEKT